MATEMYRACAPYFKICFEGISQVDAEFVGGNIKITMRSVSDSAFEDEFQSGLLRKSLVVQDEHGNSIVEKLHRCTLTGRFPVMAILRSIMADSDDFLDSEGCFLDFEIPNSEFIKINLLRI